ncbi:MAG: Hsp20/alpha crystallin family protein [Candidatus Aenigmarchaeota archaeon]|nr:Hsp20/alpha crystallin family protein [Candidatus Aenigmarchaeota archaeon]
MNDDYEFYWEKPGRKKHVKQPVKRHLRFEEDVEPFEIDLNFPKLNMPRAKMSIQIMAPIHLKETEKEIIAITKMHGFRKEDIKFHVSEKRLDIIAGQRHEEKRQSKEAFSHTQSSSIINRSIELPIRIDPKNVSAKQENETLVIVMPKLQKSAMEKLKEKLRKRNQSSSS